MMTDSERIIKELDLDYKTIIKDVAWVMHPLDFLCKYKIVLISEHKYKHEMLLLDAEDNVIETKSFRCVGNVTDIYSYMCRYYYNNLTNKTKKDELIKRD